MIIYVVVILVIKEFVNGIIKFDILFFFFIGKKIRKFNFNIGMVFRKVIIDKFRSCF